MLFNSFTYMLFLPAVVLLYWAIPSRLKGSRTTLLLVASYVFYMNWKPAYGLLILRPDADQLRSRIALKSMPPRKNDTDCRLDFQFGLPLLFQIRKLHYRLHLLWSAWAEYTFHARSRQRLDKPSLEDHSASGYFVFHFRIHSLHSRRLIAVMQRFAISAILRFCSLFPFTNSRTDQALSDFTHQLAEKPIFNSANFREGMFLILQGLFKKIVLGDNLGYVVNTGFNHISRMGFVDTWIAVAGFTFQIFFDFSGYTDIGRGSALLLGYKVPEKFQLAFSLSI